MIPEDQLDTWTSLGAAQQSAATYQTIKRALESDASPYASRQYNVFLQGSYGNDTNVWRDSDVDIVIRLHTGTFYYDVSKLQPGERAIFEREYPSAAEYTLDPFKRDVIAWLGQQYGADFDPTGSKAVLIRASGNRRNADVLICAEHKAFSGFPKGPGEFASGVFFMPRNGGSIINYPQHHSANLTKRHQDTNEWLKPVIRVVKNMRNRMIDDGALDEGIAPSYFLEGLLYNVPLNCFHTSLQSTVDRVLTFAATADQSQLACANMQHWLVRDWQHTSWPTSNYATFVATARDYWNDW
jgi:hypothetical protein